MEASAQALVEQVRGPQQTTVHDQVSEVVQ
jgi:hypothetical protein